MSGETDERFDNNPWIVGVFKKNNGIEDFMCSGSLISNQHVLVSGICVREVHMQRDTSAARILIHMGDGADVIT